MNLGRRTHCAHETSSVPAVPNKTNQLDLEVSRFRVVFQRLL